MPSNLIHESMTFGAQDEITPRYDNGPVVYRADVPDSFPPLQRCPGSTPPQPLPRPRYSAEQLVGLQEDYEEILSSAEHMQAAPSAAQQNPAVQALLQRSRHLEDVARLVQEQVRTNTEQRQEMARHEQELLHRLERRRSQQRRALRRASHLSQRTSSRRGSGSSQGTLSDNPLPHLNQPTSFRRDSVICRESRRSVELFTPEQIARISRRQSHSLLRGPASPEGFPRLRPRSRNVSMVAEAQQRLINQRPRDQESYRAQRPNDHHQPLSASWPRDRFTQRSRSRSSTISPWIRRHQPRPAARQGFRSPETHHSDLSSDHAGDDIEQMRHSWPQTPARPRHAPRDGIPLAPRPEPATLHREQPAPPSPVHAELYPALSVEEQLPSPEDSGVYTEQGPAFGADASPPSPVHGIMYPESLSPAPPSNDTHTQSLLSELGVQWRETRWDAGTERSSASSNWRRSPRYTGIERSSASSNWTRSPRYAGGERSSASSNWRRSPRVADRERPNISSNWRRRSPRSDAGGERSSASSNWRRSPRYAGRERPGISSNWRRRSPRP
jgi:hypothetical protein